ncbi:MAG: protein tyrosine phosphatase [Microbacterium sp.]|nr:protein tyrosine phosphatase [Microbacterium sp.]
MNDAYKRTVPITSAPNLRDLGGIPAANGSVKRGVLYRSASLSSLTEPGQAWFSMLGIETVYDLRTAAEAAESPDRLPPGTDRISLDVLAGASASIAASVGQLTTDPRAFVASLADGQAERLFEDSYRDFIRLPSALSAYRAFYLGLIDEGRHGAALFHCTTGKDRTGWAAASLLTLLGASEADVYDDYLQTNIDLLPALEPVLQQAESHGVEREALMPVLGVRESYLAASFRQMHDQFGSIDEYATDGLGLSSEQQHRLRTTLT